MPHTPKTLRNSDHLCGVLLAACACAADHMQRKLIDGLEARGVVSVTSAAVGTTAKGSDAQDAQELLVSRTPTSTVVMADDVARI